MKNTIAYYYHLMPDEIHKKDKNYFFSISGYQYVFFMCPLDYNQIEKRDELSKYLNQYHINIHTVVPNKDHDFATKVQTENYVLLKIQVDSFKTLSWNELIFFTNLFVPIENFSLLRRDSWDTLWSDKIDYFEYQVSQLGRNYPLILESFNYFVGLVENGISMYHNYYNKDQRLVISHRRIRNDSNLLELYNPFNLVLDYPIRDVCEFFKSEFIKGVDVLEPIINYITSSHLTSYEIIMFFIRMFYPSFYFDLYEQIIIGQKKEEELLPIINKIPDYELLLKRLYFRLERFTQMPEIDWIKEL